MFEIHYGTCIKCEKDDVLLVVKKGYCGPCNHKIKQEKKKKDGKSVKKYKYLKGPTGEKHVFEAFIENMEDVETRCFVCGIRVPLLTHNNFAHVLSKGKYPKFRLNPDNLVVLCHRIVADDDGNQGCHYAYDMKPHSELKGEGWERLFELRDKLINQYKQIENESP